MATGWDTVAIEKRFNGDNYCSIGDSGVIIVAKLVMKRYNLQRYLPTRSWHEHYTFLSQFLLAHITNSVFDLIMFEGLPLSKPY